MWILLLVFLTVGGSVEQEAPIEGYLDFLTCYEEGTRIQEEMEKAYPGDTSFKLVCRYMPPQA